MWSGEFVSEVALPPTADISQSPTSSFINGLYIVDFPIKEVVAPQLQGFKFNTITTLE